MFTWTLQKFNLKVVEHKFMVPGHNHLEVDTDHGIIEKKKEKVDLQIYHPRNWIISSSLKKQFEVVEMRSTDFLHISSLL